MAAQKCCFRLKNIYPLRIFLQTELFRRNGFLTPLNFDFLLSTTSKITHTHYLVARNSNSYRNSLRCYSASSKRPKTTAILNPLKDEDGTDMKIEITPRASNVFLSLLLTQYSLYLLVKEILTSFFLKKWVASERNYVTRFQS